MSDTSATSRPKPPLERRDWWVFFRWWLLFFPAFWVVAQALRWAGASTSAVWWSWHPDGVVYGLEQIWTLSLIGALLAVAATKRQWRLVLGLAATAWFLRCEPVFALYAWAASAILYPLAHLRSQAAAFAFTSVLVLMTVVIPKCWHGFAGDAVPAAQVFSHIGLTGILIRYLWYFHEWRRRAGERPGYFEHLSYLFFIPQIAAVLNFKPAGVWTASEQENEDDAAAAYAATYRSGWAAVGWAFVKLAVFNQLAALSPDIWNPQAGMIEVWIGAWFNAALWYCWLSAHYDLAVAVCRFLGATVPSAFQFPLLATSPADYWRRWSLFQHLSLRDLVYIPLGGSRSHRWRNLWIVFTLSALLPLSGWLTYWDLRGVDGGVSPLAALTFAWLQALALTVSGWRRPPVVAMGSDVEGSYSDLPQRPSQSRWRVALRWCLTQSFIAWCWLLLPIVNGTNSLQNETLMLRLRVMARALGISLD